MSRPLVPFRGEVVVSWDVIDAASCTVSGNGNVWTGTTGEYPSGPLEHPATFTLTCDGGDEDTLEDDLTDTAVVQMAPTFEEL